MMAAMVMDPRLEEALLRDRKTKGLDRWDECWDGVYVMAASPNTEHQVFVSRLNSIFSGCIDWERGEMSLPGGNVSDRTPDWEKNYRIPDVLVYLEGGSARDYNSHWVGGLDFLVEIASPGEDPRKKLDFYSALGTRELLVLERKPWALELYKLRRGKLKSIGRSDVLTLAVLTSTVLPLSFQLQPSGPRPKVLVKHSVTGQIWTV